MASNSGKRLYYALFPAMLFVVALWLIALLQWGLEKEWYNWGILPRTAEGIKGIFFSAFLHRDFMHLLANTPALLILGWFVYYFYKDIANEIMLFIWGGSGLLTWLIARPSYHIGASGMIYGIAFFLFFSGIFRKNTRLAAIALITVFIYGSLLWNMFPIAELVDPSVSWEGHLSGALSGLATAVLLRKKGPRPDPLPEDEAGDDSMETEAEDEVTSGQSDFIQQPSAHEATTTEKSDSK
ncbi:MAG: rhomboid family intramembrane serine protease [Bacteroidales bacterium]